MLNMLTITKNVSEGLLVSLTSTSQNLNAASKIDMVLSTTQVQSLPPAPRIPGLGEEYVAYVAPDFDDSLDLQPGE